MGQKCPNTTLSVSSILREYTRPRLLFAGDPSSWASETEERGRAKGETDFVHLAESENDKKSTTEVMNFVSIHRHQLLDAQDQAFIEYYFRSAGENTISQQRRRGRARLEKEPLAQSLR